MRPRAPTPDGISVIGSTLRSVNLDRDIGAPDLGPIYVGARVQDTLTRLAAALEDRTRTRAWSLTGPYGSGKSTLALLIDALLGPPNARREQAEQVLGDATPELAQRITTHRDCQAPEGFLTAVATARREPLAATLTRAVLSCANRRWFTGKHPRRVATALKSLRAHGSGNSELLAALQALCAEGPTLLAIDEFGKTLEHLAGHQDIEDARNDVFLLQEIAELGAGAVGQLLYTFTLQHLSFQDYASRSTLLQRREWAKIQGRFEDITFSSDLSDAVGLITHCLSHDGVAEAGRELIRQHASASAEAWSQLGLGAVLPADAGLFAALYPLHPLTAAAAPLLAAQIGQHDRTLTGFLASDEPHTVARFLTPNATVPTSHVTTVRLPDLYDYFLASGRTTMLASANSSRWIEIDLILSQAHGLADQDQQVLKTIGVLNLIGASGALRASPGIVSFALTDPANDCDDVARKSWIGRLDTLAERGFLVYREFSDEYRIWQGSDIDLRARINEIRERCSDHSVVKTLAAHLPGAVVAGRHSQRTGMLRHFTTTATDARTSHVQGPAVGEAADGLVIFHFGTDADLPAIDSPLPAVAVTSSETQAVLDIGRDLLALEELLTDAALDPIARREVLERAGQTRASLAAAMAAAFAPAMPGSRWHLLNPALPQRTEQSTNAAENATLTGRSLSAIVSAVCEIAYPATPHIRNEMLGRHQLTSQGAKARRELITAMLTHPASEKLGIEGYGPERAMYEGVVKYLGLHQEDPAVLTADKSRRFQFAEPSNLSPLYPAWAALRKTLRQATSGRGVDEIFDLLMAPPFGVKAGVVPVIVIAALILTSDDVALFEDGTYQPTLGPGLAERLIKAPGRYTITYVPVYEGQRQLALQRLSARLGMKPVPRAGRERNPALLAVTRELLSHVRDLTSYTRGTRRLSENATAVRDALTAARDPGDLVFTVLPRAVKLNKISISDPCDEPGAATFASSIVAALGEIQSADRLLRAEALETFAREFHLPTHVSSIRQVLAGRVSGFADTVAEPELRGLLSVVLNESLTDDEWLDPIAVRMVQAGFANWTDKHPALFAAACRRMAKALDRLIYLHWNDRHNPQSAETALRLVTVTNEDGHETRVLISLPHTARETAAELAQAAISNAKDQLGPGGGLTLLAEIAAAIEVAEGANDAPNRP